MLLTMFFCAVAIMCIDNLVVFFVIVPLSMACWRIKTELILELQQHSHFLPRLLFEFCCDFLQGSSTTTTCRCCSPPSTAWPTQHSTVLWARTRATASCWPAGGWAAATVVAATTGPMSTTATRPPTPTRWPWTTSTAPRPLFCSATPRSRELKTQRGDVNFPQRFTDHSVQRADELCQMLLSTSLRMHGRDTAATKNITFKNCLICDQLITTTNVCCEGDGSASGQASMSLCPSVCPVVFVIVCMNALKQSVSLRLPLTHFRATGASCCPALSPQKQNQLEEFHQRDIMSCAMKRLWFSFSVVFINILSETFVAIVNVQIHCGIKSWKYFYFHVWVGFFPRQEWLFSPSDTLQLHCHFMASWIGVWLGCASAAGCLLLSAYWYIHRSQVNEELQMELSVCENEMPLFVSSERQSFLWRVMVHRHCPRANRIGRESGLCVRVCDCVSLGCRSSCCLWGGCRVTGSHIITLFT